MPPADAPGPRRRPRRTTRRQVSQARAQQSQYVSQGRAVQRAASRPARRPRRPVAAVIPGLGERKVRRAISRPAPSRRAGRRVVPAIPGLGERKVRREIRRPHPEQSIPGLGDVLAARPKPEHRNFVQTVFRAMYGGGSSSRDREATAGSPPALGGLPYKAAWNVGLVLGEDPKKQVPKLAKDTAESVVSIPAGVVRAATDPLGAGKSIAKDYARRYKPLLEGDDEAFRARLRKEGVAPEVFDIAGLGSGGSAVAGRTLQTVAKTGQLGRAAERIATTRPALRVSGGEVKAQPTSDNFFRNVVRHAIDQGPLVSRRAVQTRRASRDDASALVRQAQAEGQVTKIGVRAQGRAQRKSVAQSKGRMLTMMKAEQQAETGATSKTIKSLGKDERRAFKYAMQYGATTPAAARRVLTAHRGRVAEAQAELRAEGRAVPRQNELPEIDHLLENADRAFTPRLAAAVREEGARAQRLAEGDPGVDVQQALTRREMPLRELVRTTGVDTEGLDRPGYFPSEKRPEGVFSARALGGRQAVKGPGTYTGALTRSGRENVDPEVFVRGVARNIKRKYNWNLVAQNFDRHAYDWSKGKTIEQLKDEMERRGIDPGSVAFWNPRKFRDEQRAAATLEGPDVEAGAVAAEAANVHDAAQLATNPAAFKDSPGWSLIPKAVHDEIMTDVRPSGAVGRSVDVATGKISRMLLGNPGWLQFQTASNAFLTGLAGAGPVDMVKAQVWWRKLPDEQKRAIEPYIGVHRWYDDQTRLGAAANNKMVNAYRAFKETGLYRAAHKGNPLDALFKADNAQNNFFRRAVFYNKAKRETYKRMGQEAGKIMALQQRAARVLRLPPEKQMEAVIRDAETFERLAEHTNKFLGDYTTYTAAERRTLGRVVMFYGFLRYSVRFTLYTMPIEHPIVSSLLTQIGRLERDEQKKIFGADVPPWELGNLYTGEGKRYQLARLNPFFNAAQWGEPGALTSSLSPLVQIAMNQLASKNVAFQRPYTVGGSGQYVEKSLPGSPPTALVPGTVRSRVAGEEFLRLSPYYRIFEKTGVPGIAAPLRGKQTSESGLLWPDPVRYKGTTATSREAQARNERSKREQAAGGAPRDLREQLLPLLGQHGQDVIRKAREFDEAERKKGKGKKRRARSLFDAPKSGGGSLFDTPRSGGGKSLFD